MKTISHCVYIITVSSLRCLELDISLYSQGTKYGYYILPYLDPFFIFFASFLRTHFSFHL